MRQPRVIVIDDHYELAELLSAALEHEGVATTVVCSGAQALAEAERSSPDLAIVDIVLPDMLGTEVLDALSRLDPPVPTVAVSGVFRGEKYSRLVCYRHGARDFFEKPFSTTAVVASILAILRDLGKLEGEPPGTETSEEPLHIDLSGTIHLQSDEEQEIFPDAASVLGEDCSFLHASPLDGPPPCSDTSSEPHAAEEACSHATAGVARADAEQGTEEDSSDSQRRQSKHMGFVEDLISELESDPPVTSLDLCDGPSPDERVREALETGIHTPREAARTSIELCDPGLPTRIETLPPSIVKKTIAKAPLARGGSIAESTVPRLLVGCHEAGSTGALELQRGRVVKAIYMRDGLPTFAGSNLAGDRILGFAVRLGAIRREDADSVLALSRQEGRRIGELLIELGVLERRALNRLVQDQVRAIIWSTFAWREGTYSIRPHREGKVEPITLDLPVGTLVLEGTQRAVPLETLQADLPDEMVLSPGHAPAVSIASLPLTPPEEAVLAAADGSKTVGDLVALADEDDRRVRALLRALWDLGALTTRDRSPPRDRRIGFAL